MEQSKSEIVRKSLDTLAELQKLWDRCLGHMDTGKHGIELTASDFRPINSTLYRNGPKPRESKKEEFDEMLPLTDIESTKLELSLHILFARKKDYSLEICIGNRILSTLPINNDYPVTRIKYCLDVRVQREYYQRWTAIMGVGQMKMTP